MERANVVKDDFILAVLELFARHDRHSEVWWRTDGAYAPITFFVNCNDVFAWGCADCEQLTEETLPALAQAYQDSDKVGAELFCSRVRKERPQGAFYAYIPEEEWPLFDACGPEREVGPGNPYLQGTYKR